MDQYLNLQSVIGIGTIGAGESANVDLSLNLAPNKKIRSLQLSLKLFETIGLCTLSLFKIE